MVTETKPEATPEVITQEPAALVEETAAPTSTPVVGDAGSTPVADAAEVTSDADIAAMADAFKEYQSKEGEAEHKETQAERRPAVDPALTQRAIATYRQNYQTRQQAADDYDAELESVGVSSALRKRWVKDFKDRLNEQYADGLEYAGFESYEIAKKEAGMAFGQALEATLSPAIQKELAAAVTAYRKEHDDLMPYSEALKIVRDEVGKEAVAAAKQRIFNEGWNAANLARQKRGDTSASSGTPQGAGASRGKGWRTKAEARNLHAQGQITDAEMRRIRDDSSIPDGY